MWIVDNENYILQKADNLTLDFSIDCIEGVMCISPYLLTLITEEGQANSYDLRILSSGNFTLEVSYFDFYNDSISLGPITNLVKTLELQLNPENLTIYTMTTINITVLGEDDYYFSENCTVDLVDNLLNDLPSQTAVEGYAEFEYFFNNTNITQISASCNGVETSASVNLEPLILEIELSSTVISIQPSTNNDTFNFTIRVLNSFLEPESDNYNGGVYRLFVSLLPNEFDYSGVVVWDYENSTAYDLEDLVVETVGGVWMSGNFSVLSSGNFSIFVTVDEPEVLDVYSESFRVENEILSVGLLASDDSLSPDQPFSYQVNLTGIDNNTFILNRTVYVVHELIEFNESCEAIEGSCIINTKLSENGLYTVHAQADYVISDSYNISVNSWKLIPSTLELVISI